MASSYSLYIDEAGDEGFSWSETYQSKGSTRWFIISGVVAVTANRSLIDKIVNQVCLDAGKNPRKNLHWRRLKPKQKDAYAKLIAGSNQLKGINICVHKPNLDPSTFSAERLYFYATRFLIERASWLVRDSFAIHEGKGIPGDGTVEIIFSKRENMNYEAFENYMSRLRIGHSTSIEWRHIGKIKVLGAGQSKGLQIADAIGGAAFNALNPSPGRVSEPKYLELMKPSLYQRSGNYTSYGLKFFPPAVKQSLEREPGYEWLLNYK